MSLYRYALAAYLCAAAASAGQQPPPAPPGPDMNSAVEEFKIQTRNLGLRPDSPRKSGRRPVQDWHGRLFENFRNDALDAIPHEIRQNGGDKDLLRRNQFGFNVAGPVVIPRLLDGHGNTYFSLSYEGVRENIDRTYLQTIPTVPQRTGDYSDVLDPGGILSPPRPETSFRLRPRHHPSQSGLRRFPTRLDHQSAVPARALPRQPHPRH